MREGTRSRVFEKTLALGEGRGGGGVRTLAGETAFPSYASSRAPLRVETTRGEEKRMLREVAQQTSLGVNLVEGREWK